MKIKNFKIWLGELKTAFVWWAAARLICGVVGTLVLLTRLSERRQGESGRRT